MKTPHQPGLQRLHLKPILMQHTDWDILEQRFQVL
jgi:hypothetical protein